MMTSRKRGKAAKGKKNSPAGSNSSRSSITASGVGPGGAAAAGNEPNPAAVDAAAAAAKGCAGGVEDLEAKVNPVALKTENSAEDKPWKRAAGEKTGAGKSKAPPGALVYFDPKTILPPEDKRRAPWGETAEEQRRYNNRWMFTPATVLSASDPDPGVVLIRTRDSEVHRAKAAELETVNPQALEGVPDAMSVSNLTQASLLHTVRERYNRDEVYTRVGPVLMSVNPYKWIVGLYSEEAMLSYHGKAAMVEAGMADLAPHLFGVADHAYSQLVKGHLEAEAETKEDVRKRKARASNQSIIISGESGSGKTEATKIIMQYLARITSAEAGDEGTGGESDGTAATHSEETRDSRLASSAIIEHVGDLEGRVLSCNPLLESFGNAVTLKNDNSSRFGKFIKIQFDKKGRIRGAQIQNYLLEKTRIVAQAKRERSYHIFYQLLAGASAALKKELKLEKGVAGFECLKGSSIKDVDKPDFLHTKECMSKIGVEAEGRDGQHGQDSIFRLIAAIMHLLNVGFKSVHVNEGEACEIQEKTRPSLAFAAELLGVEADELEKAAVSKTMAVHSTSTMMLQTVEQAHDKVAALGKALYSQLFLWLVAKLNTTISAPQSDVWGFIGVLDIYGFEKFNTNSLEQLLINYANEHLQRHFNQHMFEVEQVDYDKEQIDWSYITFNDNKACLELIDGKGGLFSCLDDIQRFEGKEANLKFLSSFKQKHGPAASGGSSLRSTMSKSGSAFGSIASPATTRKSTDGHPHFVSPRFDPDTSFGIKHYAGDVFYSVARFNQKNRENLTADMKELMASSTNAFVTDVFKAGEQDEGNGGGDDDDDDEPFEVPVRGRGGAGGRTIRSKSIGIQFKESLAELMATISITHPRYIRCVKPNPDKQSGRFDGEDVLLQLQYSGTMETIRIRQQGYALRELKDDFLKKYKVLHPSSEGLEALVAYLSSMLGASNRDWQIGTSKVFLRTSMSDKLNLMVELRRKCASRVIQRWLINTKRRTVVRSTLQPFLKKALVILKYRRAAVYFRNLLNERRAATSIGRWYRLSRDRNRFVSIKKAERVVKALLRVKYFVTQLEVRKEFALRTSGDVDAAIEDLVAQEKALKEKKDFLACLPIASRLHHLRIVGKAMREREERRKELAAGGDEEAGGASGGADGGAARREIEVRLLEAQWRMADAEADQNYSLCTRLQRDIKGLEAQREQHPTLAELKEKEEKTQAGIDDAAAKADYALASTLQTELLVIEKKIKAIEEQEEACKSQAALKDLNQKELEEKMAATIDELEEAKSAKEFAKCIDLQARLSELQAASDSMPTLEEVEREVLSAEGEMATARAKKDYRRAAELFVKLPAMHDRHSAVASAIRKAMNRKQLAEEVQRLEGEMRLAKAEKKFSQCSLLQRSLAEMQALTDALPSVRELEEEISEVRSKMNTAVSERNYAEAEHCRVRLNELAEEKTLALEKEQHSNPSSSDPLAKARQRLSASSRDFNDTADQTLSSPSPESGGAMDSGSLGSPPPPPPPADAGSADMSFTSPKVVRVKEGPAILSPVKATPASARVATTRPPSSATVVKGSDDVSVSRLRPKPAVTLPEETTVTEVCRVLASSRSDAALLTGANGGMTGIVTAIDFIRRVVAVGVDPNTTAATEVMTHNPTTVLSDDSAMEALSIMLGRHFRHLPVRSPRGDVTGVLDIAKCLYDAVSRLQRIAKRKSLEGGNAAEATMAMMTELGKGKGKNRAAMQALLLKMFEDEPDGGSGVSVSLAELLASKGEPQLVYAHDSARGAARAIARGRKAVLVVDNGGLAGIFTEKDMLNRVLSKGLNADEVSVSDVMTPNPDTVPSTMTVLEALQEMHENKYLHLPVVDESNGNVLGVVSVMEIIQATAGEEGSTGWKALFGSGLDAAGDGFSDTSSFASLGSAGTRGGASARASTRGPSARLSVAPRQQPAPPSSVAASTKRAADSRPVSVLRPKPPLCLSSSWSVYDVAKKMAESRADAAVLLDSHGQLEGIVTDHDIARRLVANKLDPSTTVVGEIMTPHPTIVRMTDGAMDCLSIMIEKHFRHLPVIDGEGNVTGLLNIAKCLYDAIHRLKKKASRAGAEESSEDASLAAAVLQAASAAKGRGKAKELKAALALLRASTSDGELHAEPTLGGILSRQAPVFVDGRDSVTDAAIAIARGKKAVLVLTAGRLAGIVTPKDLLMRVVAKGLDPDRTPVSDIMTSNPDTVPPEMTAVEALGEMHENKYLHLPVVDLDASLVVGVVNVMEILQATAGDRGSSSWEAFFGSAMDAGDDVSDSASMYSVDRSVRSMSMSVRQRGGGVGATPRPVSAAAEPPKGDVARRPVSSLKPKAPLCLSVELTVSQVAKRMAEVRTDAVILLGAQGDMKGILTDHDVARKVVGQSLDPEHTPVSLVMVPDPIWVTSTDDAMDALESMLEGDTRHLPVVSEEGAVSGLLSISKCLYDAIHQLEKKAAMAEGQGEGTSNKKQELAASMRKMHAKSAGKKNGKSTLAAMMMLLQELSDGEEEPTLEDILSQQTGEFASEMDSVATAGKAISRSKKAVLVLQAGRLAGIVTPKDLLMRVVAKGLDPDDTLVSAVMTPNPDTVPPKMTAIEALREMHENKYLHLPVVDESNGKVLGVVSVMEIILAAAGEKGSDRWLAFFGDPGDDMSDSASMLSAEMSMRSAAAGGGGVGGGGGKLEDEDTVLAARSDKKVSALRPKRPVVMPCDGSVLEVATEMTHRRTDAALLTKRGRVVGIITDHDLTRRVIALDKHPDRTPARDVMTPEPTMVSMEESAMEALGLMIQNKTRHLPVVDATGKVNGLLDIAKCLYDAVTRLEKAAKKKAAEEAAGGGDVASDNTERIGVVVEAAKAMKGKASAKHQRALQELLLLAMAGPDEEREGASQTLSDVLACKEKAEFVRPRHTVREAASVMAAQKKAVLVVEEGELLGIFTPKDMMNRVVTKRLNPGTTAVSSVMTPNPECGSQSMTVVETLQQMCENRYLHLPVVDEHTGVVLGVVDVMEIIQATVGQEGSSGWEAFFGSAMDAADAMSDTLSETSLHSKRSMLSARPPGTPGTNVTRNTRQPTSASRRPGSVRGEGSIKGGEEAAMSDVSRDVRGLELDGWEEKFVYKVNDDEGNLYKFRASAERLESVLAAVSDKLKIPRDAILLKYKDDDGDQIVLSGDDSLLEAVDIARASSKPALMLVASLKLQTLDEGDDEHHTEGSSAAVITKALASNPAAAIGIGAVAVVSMVAIFMSRGKR